MRAERLKRATSFGAWADKYDDCRPTYPSTAVAWLVNNAGRIVEAGAGTGKLTDRLVELPGISLDVTEIDGRMLRLISARHPSLPVHEASCSALPFEDGSIDTVLVADAWHWFPKEEAAAELRRLLRPGGWLGSVWNDMSTSTPDWQWGATRLNAEIAANVRDMAPLERLGLSSGLASQRIFPWSWSLTPRQLREYVSTLSHVRALPPQELQEAIALAERFATEACLEAGTPTVDVHLDAVCIRWLPS